MKLRAITESNSNTLVDQCGYQPSWLYVGTGGSLVVTPKSDDTDVTMSVENGSWIPADDIKYVKTASTCSSLVGFGGRG